MSKDSFLSLTENRFAHIYKIRPLMLIQKIQSMLQLDISKLKKLTGGQKQPIRVTKVSRYMILFYMLNCFLMQTLQALPNQMAAEYGGDR